MKAFKIFFIMVIMLLPFAFSSCSSDDSPSGAGSKIVGAWTFTDDDIDYIYRFNADGTFSFTAKITDEEYFEEFAEGTYEYSEEDSKLIIYWSDEYESDVETVEVVSVSSTKLVLRSEGETITLTKYKD